MIRRLLTGKYRLYSRKKDPKTGKRRNLGTFATRQAARTTRARGAVLQTQRVAYLVPVGLFRPKANLHFAPFARLVASLERASGIPQASNRRPP